MTVPVRYLGIDVAKLTLSVWVAGQRQPLGTLPNTPDGWQDLAARLAPAPSDDPAPLHLVVEPTGGYEAGLVAFARQQGWTVSLVNPVRVRQWVQSQGRRAKNDRQDARMLADYGAANGPPVSHPIPAEVTHLDTLLRRKTDLEEMLRRERNRQEAAGLRPDAAPAVGASIGRLIAAVKEELQQIEQAIADHLAGEQERQEQCRLLTSVPGVGAKTVPQLLVLFGRYHGMTGGRGDASGVTALVGLDPRDDRSGTSVQGRATISRMGNRDLRRRLFMAALGGVRGNNVLRGYYQRMVARGKPKKLALVAAARKLLTWAWAVYRDGVAFPAAKATPKPAAPALT